MGYNGKDTKKFCQTGHYFHLPGKFHQQQQNDLPENFYALSFTYPFPFVYLYLQPQENAQLIKFYQKNLRVHLPKELSDFLQLKDKVTILGLGDHLELWLPEHYRRYQASKTLEDRQKLWREINKI